MRICPGQLSVMTSEPSPAPSIGLPSPRRPAPAESPNIGLVALPGLSGVAPGRGEIMIPPVSVCHQVSTIGQRPSPTTRWYQPHASGLIGSPTVPSSFNDLREVFWTQSSPSRISARSAVGAV